jgi:hypothetical protein
MPMRRKLQERFARIETEARKLARSGQHRWSHSIEMALLARGYRDAPRVFANRWTQCELDRLCEQATHARVGAAAA